MITIQEKTVDTGIREYAEGIVVEIGPRKDRLCVIAYNEAGCCQTNVDLLDVISWVRKHRPELMV